MTHPLVIMFVVVTTLYQKRGGHCFFIFKSGVILENTRFLITNGVSDLTLPLALGRKYNEFFKGRIEENTRYDPISRRGGIRWKLRLCEGKRGCPNASGVFQILHYNI